MIRIDLGKGAGKKGSSEGASKFALPGNLKLPPIKMDLKLGILVAIATAFACLPHLFVNQYKSYLTSQHQLGLKQIQAESDKLKQEIARFQTFQKEMESYEEQKRKVRERLEVVKQLLTLRGTPVNVLDAIGQSLPQRVWLSNIDLTLTGTTQIAISGKSYSGEEISDFVDKLGESIYLGDINLDGVTTQRESETTGDLKAFQLFATPKGIALSGARSPGSANTPGQTTPGLPGSQSSPVLAVPVTKAVGAK